MLGNNKKGVRSRRLGFKGLGVLCALMIPMLSVSAGGALPLPKSVGTQLRKASFYADLGVGINIFNSSATSDTTARANAASTVSGTLRQVGRMINSSTTAAFGLGYFFPVNRWFSLGARLFVDYVENRGGMANQIFNVPNLRQFNNTSTKLRDFEYGIDVTPSAAVGANQFLTGVFGVAFNRARLISEAGADAVNLAPNVTTPPRRVTMKRSMTGLRLGYRVEELLNRNLSLFMTYVWTGYGWLDILQSSPVVLFRSDTNIKFQSHKIMMGLMYYFSPQNYQSLLRHRANYFNRVYLRASFGNLIPQLVISGTTSVIQANNNLYFVHSQDGAPTPLGIIGLGYGFLVHRFYLGVEALVNIADRQSKGDQSFFDGAGREFSKNIKLRLNTFEGAFDLKYGFMVAPETLLLLRTGIAVNFVKLTNFQVRNNLVIDQNQSKTAAALRFGVGLERMFSDNVSMVMNYIYTYYGHVSAEQTISGVVPAGGATVLTSTADARVATHAVTIGVNYYFS